MALGIAHPGPLVVPLAAPPWSALAAGKVYGTTTPSAPFIPIPALSVTFCNATSGDASMSPAMLDAPAVVAFAASNSTFSIVSAADTFAIVSGTTPAPVCTFACWFVGS